MRATLVLATEGDGLRNDLFTFVIRMPKCLVAQFNTHGSLARNSASSRAIPHKRFREMVETDPFIPQFVKHQSGMAANDPLEAEANDNAVDTWLAARDFAVKQHKRMEDAGVSKGQANRLLEPFMYTEVIATGTRAAWEAFCALRNHADAQTEMQVVAGQVQSLLESAVPCKSEVHLPMADAVDDRLEWPPEQQRLVTSVVNCARVSYLNHGKVQPFTDKLKRYNSMLEANPFHASPFEHQAIMDDECEWLSGRFGSFGPTNWQQLRKNIEADSTAEWIIK